MFTVHVRVSYVHDYAYKKKYCIKNSTYMYTHICTITLVS